MTLTLLRGALAAIAIALASAAPVQAANMFYDLGTLPAPSTSVDQLAYSLTYNTLIVMSTGGLTPASYTGSTITTINTATQATSTHAAIANFTDMHVSPSGRYVYATDNCAYLNSGIPQILGTPSCQNHVHRLDLATGAWGVDTAHTAGQIETMSDDTFAVESFDGKASVDVYQWYPEFSTAVHLYGVTGLQTPHGVPTQGGDFRYVSSYNRLIFGESDVLELYAYKVANQTLTPQEDAGLTIDAYRLSGPLALSTDQTALYFGSLEVSTQDVSHHVQVFPEWIFAATGTVAFGKASYYDSKTGAALGSLGEQPTIYGMDPLSTDFWVYDSVAKQLHHYASTPSPQPVGAAEFTGLVMSCSSALMSGATGHCSATAAYSNGSNQAATPSWTSSNPAALTIDGQGKLTAQTVMISTPVTIAASLTVGSVTQTQSATVTVNSTHVLESLALTCPQDLNPGQSSVCTATASFSDGTTQPVTPTLTSSDPGALVVNADGSITAQMPLGSRNVSVKASYTSYGVTVTQYANVSIWSIKPASITLSAVSTNGVTATITPDVLDVGDTQSVWMGAIYDGILYLRNGNSWQPSTSGSYPAAIPAQKLAASNTIDVVDNLDISGLDGLQLYLGFGKDQNDMLTTLGKLALIYRVPFRLTGISLQPATVVLDSQFPTVLPQPNSASLGTCTSSNVNVAIIGPDGTFISPQNPGTTTITCSGRTATLVVLPPLLQNINLLQTSLAVGQQTQIFPYPSKAILGTCTSSDTSVASVSGAVVTAIGVGRATISCSNTPYGHYIDVTAKPECGQVPAGNYEGNVTGNYTGSATLTLTQQSGVLFDVTGSLTINGLGTANISGQANLPTVNLVGYCAGGSGTYQCFSASGTLHNGLLAGSYSTDNYGSGAFSLNEVCN
ncbi:MAG: hypothetical protein JO218_16705 [Burkholderiales bacterium]|nr:hypothetical protein [Burkholderiales bacterium]